jgi:hypothetical protein
MGRPLAGPGLYIGGDTVRAAEEPAALTVVSFFNKFIKIQN